ncbi:MAG: twin-arginine translocation signal domain-containing protein [Acidobacteria bacterium]|nr:twin-arginine translocation signal domain-containing protein [Acidobacteriota bacterium]
MQGSFSPSRRRFLQTLAAGALAAPAAAQIPGERPRRDPGVEVLNPLARVPVSIIIDDSTCLVNLNHFSIPQFRRAWDYKSYEQDWRSTPREIPDSFVRKFGEWAAENGVKGKYSIVPYPACVGRLDIEVPGWTRQELDASIGLVRDLMTPNWDIHPEMITHTRVIDLKTGHPIPECNLQTMENWRWSDNRSVDELASYMSYALRILHNIDLPCEGVTTPGGFGTRALPQLSQATLEACRDVYRAEIPHYFRHLFDKGEESVAPRVEYAAGLDTDDPRCAVSIIGCTGDWTGGWDASTEGELDRFITPDLSAGRLVDVIERGEPACIVCHWTGVYWNGREVGFKIFQEVVRRLHARYDHLTWMKLGEISRYWAAKELTAVEKTAAGATFRAPFAAPAFTVAIEGPGEPRFQGKPLQRVGSAKQLRAGTFAEDGARRIVCFDLPKGRSELSV